MLSFISFWRAAAIVLNDLGSSAFYAGAIAEQAIGKAAPWFILAIMLFAYAVRSMYIESCSMFVRGGVYRVVKEAMGSTLAKFSVSALMFDYILTGPISGVSAGQYLTGFLNELFARFHVESGAPHQFYVGNFCDCGHGFLLVGKYQGNSGIQRKSVADYVRHHRDGGDHDWLVHFDRDRARRASAAAAVQSHDDICAGGAGMASLSTLPHTVAMIGILIGLGHSVLAMSGEETLAQVYREVEHPKLPNLEKAGLVIFVYSLIFTAGVSFFASMIIPDAVRPQFFGNLISGLALNFVGPYNLKLAFEGFVVIVGVLMLAGAVNTAIVGSNGVSKSRFRRRHSSALVPPPASALWHFLPDAEHGRGLAAPHDHPSRGDIFVLGEAYAFGVMWSFSMKGLAVLVLRYKQPGKRDFRVPLNFTIGHTEIPVGLGLITVVLFALSITNLFTKQVATISGVAFTLIFFTIFEISEKITLKHGAKHQELDQFNLESDGELCPAALGVRPGNELVMIRNSNTLYNLGAVLDRINPRLQDVVALHLRVLGRAGTGENELEAEDLFSINEQELFTRALSLAEKRGKSIHLAVAPTNAKWDGILRAAQSLQSSTIALGMSSWRAMADEARMAGLAWEALPEPRPNLTLEIYSPDGQEHVFYLGPHAPRLTQRKSIYCMGYGWN